MSAIQGWVNKLFHRSPKEHRLLFLGLDASGRTSTLYKLILGETVTTIPTIGFNVETYVYNKHSMTIWDVGGCDKIRPLWRHYFQNTQAIVFFVDSTDRERIEESEWSLGLLLTEDELRDIPLLVFANKQDLPDAMTAEEVTEKLKLGQIRDHPWYIQPSSAIRGDGLFEGLDWLLSVFESSKGETRSESKPAAKASKGGGDPSKDLDAILERWLEIEDEPDEEFITALENFTLDNWDHRTHLRLAWVYLTRHGRREGMKKIFASIKSFIDNSPRARKTTFHETMTYFWTHMVHYAIEATKNPSNDFKGFLLMNPQLANGGLFLDYFTKDLMLMKMESRQKVVLPDIKPLPSILSSLTTPSNPVVLSKKKVLSDLEFLQKFEDKTLEQWSFEDELRATYVSLYTKGRRNGTKMVHSGMEKFQGSGYNLTITYFWIQMVWYYMCTEGLDQNAGLEGPAPSPMEFSTFIEKYALLLDRKLPLKYYSEKVLYRDPKSATEFTLPDKKQLPSIIPKK